MTGSQIFRLACIVLLWALIVIYILTHTPKITVYTIFVVIASGIIVFVPLYKKYKRENDAKK